MKTTKLFSLFIFSIFLSLNAAAAGCDSCSVSAKFSSSQDSLCQITMIDLSTVDTCSTHIYSIINYGNGITDTVAPGDTIPDNFSVGTYNVCLTAYSIYSDTLGTDTCMSTFCRNVTKNACQSSSSCDTCSVSAEMSAYENAQCQWIMNDLSTTDSCSTHIFSIVDYGNGVIDTITGGDTIPDIYAQGTYELCLTAYSTYTDSTGTDTCTSTICIEITKSICQNPFRKKFIEEENSQMKVFPNPAKNELFINFSENTTHVRVFSIEGKLVFSQVNNGLTSLNLNIEEWDSGVYIVEVGSGATVTTEKLIVQ